MEDSIKINGHLKLEKINQDNVVIETRSIPNLVVTVGKDYIVKRMTSNTSNVILSHMSLGGKSDTPVASDSKLGSEMGRVVLGGKPVTSQAIVYTAEFPAGTATGTVNEAGIFNDGTSNAGAMLCRTTFTNLVKDSSDAINVTWTISVT